MGLQTIGMLASLFAICLSKPCLNLKQDKDDGFKIFTLPKGIVSDAFSSLIKREASYRPKRSVDGVFMSINDNVLYADENDLISNVKNKVFLPLYIFRSKHLAVKTRTKRAAIKECPWEEGVSLPTDGDFYAKKPSDIKTVGVPAKRKSENKKLNITRNLDVSKTSEDSEEVLNQPEEDMKTAESTLIFRPLFAYRRKQNYRRGYRIRP